MYNGKYQRHMVASCTSNYYLLAAQQEPNKKAQLLTKSFLEKKHKNVRRKMTTLKEQEN